MRLARYVVLELALAGLLLAGIGWAAPQAAREIALWRAERRAGAGAEGGPARTGRGSRLALRPRQELSAGDPAGGPDQGASAAGTFLGMSDDILLERLRDQPFVRMKVNHGGSSLSFRVDLADGSRAAWKPSQTNAQTVPRKEVAAYRLNRLLGLDAVPPAAPRSISKEELFSALNPDTAPASVARIRAETIVGPNGRVAGEASYWIPVIKDSDLDSVEGHQQITQWLTQGEPIPFNRRAAAADAANLTVFDFLIANPDRYSGGNMKTSEDGRKLFFMDNTMSFYLEPQSTDRNRALLLKQQRFSRRLHDALGFVDGPTLRRLLREPDGSEILTDAEIRALVQRREFIQKYVADLIAQFGEANVLYFP